MEHMITNICRVEYARLEDVADFKQSPVTGAGIVLAAWQILPCAPGPLLSVSESVTRAGRLFESNFSCTLKKKVLNRSLLIVRIIRDDGTQLLIGDLDHPVRFEESYSTTSKSLTFTHSSWHFPFDLQD